VGKSVNFQFLKELFLGINGDHDVVMAKTHALRRQIPILYFILLTNAVFTAISHFNSAPVWMTLGVPALAIIIGVTRSVSWHTLDVASLTPEAALAKLRSTMIMVPLLGALFVAWALWLMQYSEGDAGRQLSLFLALTAAACMSCLVHLRAAALQLAVILVLPFVVAVMMTARIVDIGMAINVLLSVSGMVFVMLSQHADFVRMVHQRGELIEKHRETELLNIENRRLATRDALTGLANRYDFMARLKHESAKAVANQTPYALLLLDLNGFKPINDLYGHAAGDMLLVKVAARLREAMTEHSHCARLGGDEFVVVLQHAACEEDVARFGRHIIASLCQPYKLQNTEVTVTASVGIAVLHAKHANEMDLMEHADYALYQAKAMPSGEPVFFNEAHEHTIRMLHRVDQSLRNNPLDSELTLHYQPILLTATHEIVAYEALARWNNEKLGNISPAVFIPAAGKSGMSEKITRILFRKLLEDCKQFPEHTKLSFNLSARDLVNTSAILQMVADIRKAGVPPKRLQFEVTEAAIATDYERVHQALTLLRALGCSVCLDNFGSGQSILNYIYRLPIDSVKIDSSFLAQCELNPAALKTLAAIVSLCDELDLTCIAVGIETKAQMELAREIGCMRMQGFYLAKPQPLLAATSQARISA
jgi:diguanylate cyclase (GGDEF)-like protein